MRNEKQKIIQKSGKQAAKRSKHAKGNTGKLPSATSSVSSGKQHSKQKAVTVHRGNANPFEKLITHMQFTQRGRKFGRQDERRGKKRAIDEIAGAQPQAEIGDAGAEVREEHDEAEPSDNDTDADLKVGDSAADDGAEQADAADADSGGLDGGAADADEGSTWQSAAYAAQFDTEWTEDSLNARVESQAKHLLELPGLGPVQLRLPDSEPLPIARRWGAAAALTPAATQLKALGVLPALRERWVAARGGHALAPAAASLLQAAGGYRDVLHTCASASAVEKDGLVHALALHALQHLIVSTRQRLRHDRKKAEVRDQGFTRPRLLVLLPFRSHALAFLNAMLALLPSNYEQVENRRRFESEFSEAEDAPKVAAAKPDDYRQLFAGNSDDCFRCGVRLTRKSTKLYASFYAADLVIASPLGVRLGMGDEGDKRRDIDFLSSIEMVLALHADIFFMQNWAHVADIFGSLNKLPTKSHDTDFNRVRVYNLDGQAMRVRQSVILSAHASPELIALIERSCSNVSGRVVTVPETAQGRIALAPRSVRQAFMRFEATDPTTVADVRLSEFKQRMLPTLLRALETGPEAQTLLFIPSYFDFVRVRELLKKEDVPFEAISEYTTPKARLCSVRRKQKHKRMLRVPQCKALMCSCYHEKMGATARIRSALQQRRLGGLLLYTERAHFFHRHKLRGARHVAFYGLPLYAHFYAELLQMVADGGAAESTCAALFCRLDLLQLDRLVGKERAARMISDKETSFVFH